tara:strand:- start:658 stop:1050 length:393 start_codon:yes stop_codon:yes gene_type:complete
MGMFSWHTNDTKRVIWVSGYKKTSTVYLIDNKGNQWKEDNYQGYGEFGGKDYYELMAEMNGFTNREEAIHLESLHRGDKGLTYLFNLDEQHNFKQYVSNEEVLFPNLVSNPNRKWTNKQPKNHENQGSRR